MFKAYEIEVILNFCRPRNKKVIVLTKPTVLLESTKIELSENEPTTIVCAAKGTPIPEVHWTKERLETGVE